MDLLGFYLAFEGIVASGKTTQLNLLYDLIIATYPNMKIMRTKEPGGSEIADHVRSTVQGEIFHSFKEPMDPITEAYLYATSRAQALRTVVAPALRDGSLVLSDRCVVTSLTNQGWGRRLKIHNVWEINKPAVGELLPDKVFYLKHPIGDLGMLLARTSDIAGDKFEDYEVEFYKRVHKGHDEVAEHEHFKDRWVEIDGKGTEDEVFNRVVLAANEHFGLNLPIPVAG